MVGFWGFSSSHHFLESLSSSSFAHACASRHLTFIRLLLQNKDSSWHQTVLEIDTTQKNALPVVDVAAYDVGDMLVEQKFTIQLGPVCFVYQLEVNVSSKQIQCKFHPWKRFQDGFEVCLVIQVNLYDSEVPWYSLTSQKRCGSRVQFLGNKLETISLSVKLAYPAILLLFFHSC